MRIGLLEDNPTISELIMTVLEMQGNRVSIYTHGASLLQTLFPENDGRASLPYDFLIVDLNLPGGMSGLEVVSRIRQTISLEALPIVIISGANQSELEYVHARLPDVPILRKPFQMQTLMQLVKTRTAT